MRAYHDREWGRPVSGDAALFERITLEGAQAGLSWSTIFNKRPAYRKAFAAFDPERVARFTARDERRLLADAGIVRNRAKIRSAIANAHAYLDLRDEVGSVTRWLRTFRDPATFSTALRSRGVHLRRPDHRRVDHARHRSAQRARARLRTGSSASTAARAGAGCRCGARKAISTALITMAAPT